MAASDAQSAPAAAEARRVAGWTKGALAFAAGVLAFAATAFGLHDRIWPPVKVRGGTILSADILELGVSRANYVGEHPIYFPHPQQTLATLTAADRARVGAVVQVVIRLEGLRGRHCELRYTVYEAQPLRPLYGAAALTSCTAVVQDGDQNGWDFWIPTPRARGAYFVRFDLYDNRGEVFGPGRRTPTFRVTRSG
jgi:hypothetical protein